MLEEEIDFMVLCQANGYSYEEYMEMIGKREQIHVLTPNGKVERVQ